MQERDVEYYKKEYFDKKRSIKDIASEHSTYSNKIKREMNRLGLQLRTKSQAQKVGREQGRIKSPTQGRKRTAEEKRKIGDARAKTWDSMTELEREETSDRSKKRWENMSKAKKAAFVDKGRKAVRQSAEEGSKMEKRILRSFLEEGYNAQFHKEQMIMNEKMQIDLFIPEKKVAIELDGPAHYEPIWGKEKLRKTQKSDKVKNGLLTMSGFSVIRVRTLQKSFSDAYGRKVFESILDTVKAIDTSKNSVIHIEV